MRPIVESGSRPRHDKYHLTPLDRALKRDPDQRGIENPIIKPTIGDLNDLLVYEARRSQFELTRRLSPQHPIYGITSHKSPNHISAETPGELSWAEKVKLSRAFNERLAHQRDGVLFERSVAETAGRIQAKVSGVFSQVQEIRP
jgi:hypothetical protein